MLSSCNLHHQVIHECRLTRSWSDRRRWTQDLLRQLLINGLPNLRLERIGLHQQKVLIGEVETGPLLLAALMTGALQQLMLQDGRENTNDLKKGAMKSSFGSG